MSTARTDRVPKQVYNVRIAEATFGPSSKGANMITVKGEVIAPAEVEFGGELYNVAGKTFTSYLSFSDKAIKLTLSTLAKLELVPVDGEDLAAFGQRAANELKNLTFNTVVGGEQLYIRKDLTPKELAEGKRPSDAEPLLGPDGQPIPAGFRTEAELRERSIWGPVVHI